MLRNIVTWTAPLAVVVCAINALVSRDSTSLTVLAGAVSAATTLRLVTPRAKSDGFQRISY